MGLCVVTFALGEHGREDETSESDGVEYGSPEDTSREARMLRALGSLGSCTWLNDRSVFMHSFKDIAEIFQAIEAEFLSDDDAFFVIGAKSFFEAFGSAAVLKNMHLQIMTHLEYDSY